MQYSKPTNDFNPKSMLPLKPEGLNATKTNISVLAGTLL